MHFKFRYQVCAGILLLGSASAAADDFLRTPIESIGLLPGWRYADEGGEVHMIGIHLELVDQWKTFWRAPGNVGLPPRLHWDKSRNVKSAEMLWPVPGVFHEDAYTYYGYEKEVVFPVELRPVEAGEEISLFIDFEFAVCNEICLPTGTALSARLPAHKTVPEAELVETLNDLQANFRIGSQDEVPRCRFTPSKFGVLASLEFELSLDGQRDAHVVLEYPDGIFRFDDAEVRRDAENLVASAEMHYFGEGAAAIDRSAIRSTVILEGMAIEFRGCTGS